MPKTALIFPVCVLLLCALPAYAQSGGGYEGLVAPASPQRGQAPPGYEGLIPGHVPVTRSMTKVPEEEDSGRPVETSEDIERLAFIHGRDRDGDGVPDGITSPRRLSFAGSRALVNGKPALEHAVSSSVAQMFNTDGSLKGMSARKAQEARGNLRAKIEGLRVKQDVPDRIYLKMGYSKQRIKEEKESLARSLSEAERAFNALEKSQ